MEKYLHFGLTIIIPVWIIFLPIINSWLPESISIGLYGSDGLSYDIPFFISVILLIGGHLFWVAYFTHHKDWKNIILVLLTGVTIVTLYYLGTLNTQSTNVRFSSQVENWATTAQIETFSSADGQISFRYPVKYFDGSSYNIKEDDGVIQIIKSNEGEDDTIVIVYRYKLPDGQSLDEFVQKLTNAEYGQVMMPYVKDKFALATLYNNSYGPQFIKTTMPTDTAEDIKNSFEKIIREDGTVFMYTKVGVQDIYVFAYKELYRVPRETGSSFDFDNLSELPYEVAISR